MSRHVPDPFYDGPQNTPVTNSPPPAIDTDRYDEPTPTTLAECAIPGSDEPTDIEPDGGLCVRRES